MTSSGPSSIQYAIDQEARLYATLWDMDDTLFIVLQRIFKNAHVLLPILLYQSVSPNQVLRILTNRSSDEEIRSDFPVEVCLQMLRDFGIDMPAAIFGGGEDNKLNVEHLHQLDLAKITALLESLKLTAHADAAEKMQHAIRELEPAMLPLQDVKHRGKNYFILKLLNQCYDKEMRRYVFKKKGDITVTCTKENLLCIMIDDNKSIPESADMLGEGFCGIKASDGGYPPKSAEDRPEFYSDGYLFKLAESIGLTAYVQSLLSDPKNHRHDNPLLQFSALLFAWQLCPSDVSIKHFEAFAQLPTESCVQMANLLGYIRCYANKHQDAHYTPIDELAERIKIFAVKAVFKDLQATKDEITALTAPFTSNVEASTAAEPARGLGRIGMLFKSKSMGGSSRTASPLQAMTAETRATLLRLSEREAKLEAQLELLQHAEFDGISTKMRTELDQAKARMQAAINPFNPMPSSSSSSNTGSRISARPSYSASSTPDLLAPPSPVLIARPLSRGERGERGERPNYVAATVVEDTPDRTSSSTSSDRNSPISSVVIGKKQAKK